MYVFKFSNVQVVKKQSIKTHIYLKLKHGLLIVDTDENVTNNDFVFMSGEFEFTSKTWVAGSPTNRRSSFVFQKVSEFSSGSIVPNQIGALNIGIEKLQNLFGFILSHFVYNVRGDHG